MDDNGETLTVNSDLVKVAITRDRETLNARYCLGEYHCQTALLRQELVPMPLLPHPLPTKHPLKNDGIRPPFPLIIQSNHDRPLILSYKQEESMSNKGGRKEKREREGREHVKNCCQQKRDSKGKPREEREGVGSSNQELPAVGNPKPTLQIGCEPKY